MSSPLPIAVLCAAFAIMTGGCGGGPSAPTPAGPSVLQAGTLSDLQAARDIIDWNMNATGGSSYRVLGKICRWDLPVPVKIAPGDDGPQVRAALEYWSAQAGMTYRLVESDALPRLLVRFGTDGLAPWGGGRGGVDGTDANNRAVSGLVVLEPGGGTFCAGGLTASRCLNLYRHELGHVFGIFSNTGVGLMATSSELSERERRMIAALYSLPHGAVVSPDGTWVVLR